jgi:hypothetical protein
MDFVLDFFGKWFIKKIYIKFLKIISSNNYQTNMTKGLYGNIDDIIVELEKLNRICIYEEKIS